MSNTNITCLCGAIKYPTISAPPFASTLCHCNPCRYTSGALYGEFPQCIKAPPDDILAQCSHYDALGDKGLRRYFCTRCGTHVFAYDRRDRRWHGLGGAIEHGGAKAVPDVITVTAHIFLDDTLDGGVVAARPGLTKLRYESGDGKDVPCYAQFTDEGDLPYESVEKLATTLKSKNVVPKPSDGDHLAVKCHCGGTDVRIRRADSEQDKANLPEGRAPQADKYHAFFCPCRSCRLANGVASMMPWASVPVLNITNAQTGEKLVLGKEAAGKDANLGTSLKHYWSSKHVCWSFCATCGATLFYFTEKSPESADVAVGNMRAPEGAFATDWLAWKDDVNYREEAVDTEILKALTAGSGAC